MRFLYGDSTPFPLAYDFLKTLEAFMTAATRIVQLDAEATVYARQREEQATNRVKGLEALEQFHNVVMRAVADTAQKVQHQNALDYARNVADYATRYIEEHRRNTLASNDRELLQVRSEAERRGAEMRTLLETFLKQARLPVQKTNLSIRSIVDGRDARYSGTASFEHPDDLSTSFTIAPQRTAAWASPRKISDFVQGVDLRVGVEKSWLRGTVTAKQLNIDDWTIVQFDLSGDAFDLVLRRKPNEKEALSFQVRRSEMGIGGTVEHPGASGAEALPGNLASQDVAMIDRVWMALERATRELVDHKEQLLNVTLDGQPVFDTGLAVPFVVRLVAMFAPTVREITKRSPNEFELTLKTETEGGRREELYLRREALLSTLAPLPAKGRDVFAPLGLDTWVPSMSNAPPPVVETLPPRYPTSEGQVLHPGVPPIPSAPPPPSRKP